MPLQVNHQHSSRASSLIITTCLSLHCPFMHSAMCCCVRVIGHRSIRHHRGPYHLPRHRSYRRRHFHREVDNHVLVRHFHRNRPCHREVRRSRDRRHRLDRRSCPSLGDLVPFGELRPPGRPPSRLPLVELRRVSSSV